MAAGAGADDLLSVDKESMAVYTNRGQKSNTRKGANRENRTRTAATYVGIVADELSTMQRSMRQKT